MYTCINKYSSSELPVILGSDMSYKNNSDLIYYVKSIGVTKEKIKSVLCLNSVNGLKVILLFFFFWPKTKVINARCFILHQCLSSSIYVM